MDYKSRLLFGPMDHVKFYSRNTFVSAMLFSYVYIRPSGPWKLSVPGAPNLLARRPYNLYLGSNETHHGWIASKFQDPRNKQMMETTITGKTFKSLTAKYLNIYTQFSLAKEEELKPVMDYQNQLDYIVAVESGVFVHSYDGNMAKAVTGH